MKPAVNFLIANPHCKPQNSNKELNLLSANVNKFSMKLNNLTYKRNLSPERKARTRTLIQIGGLVDKSGLRELFDIEIGEDLEQDIPSLNKASVLLGFLAECFENAELNEENKERVLEELNFFEEHELLGSIFDMYYRCKNNNKVGQKNVLNSAVLLYLGITSLKYDANSKIIVQLRRTYAI